MFFIIPDVSINVQTREIQKFIQVALTFKILNFNCQCRWRQKQTSVSPLLSSLTFIITSSSHQDKNTNRLSKETKTGSMSVKQEINIQVTFCSFLLSPPHLSLLSISSSAPLLPLFTLPFLSPLLICPLLSHSHTSNVSVVFSAMLLYSPLSPPPPHFFFSPPPYLFSSPPLISSPPSGPSPLRSIHCFPLSSSSLSCSWSPPLSDYDSYEVECRRHDDGELTSALRLAGGVTAVTLDHLEAYRKYSVTVRVSSAGQTSPPATHTTVTMIDREYTHTHTRTHTHRCCS